MQELLSHLLAAVCGQNPDHTWAPGGVLLPCCQRCTGLYVGAAVAALLHLRLRPRLTGRFLEIHGAFLLAMVPFGFHWVGQGPVLRALAGVLFGFGVVTFLWLPLRRGAGEQGVPCLHWRYFLILAGTLLVLPAAAQLGGLLLAHILSGLILAGALALLGLVVANVVIGLLATVRRLRRLARRQLEA